MRGIVGLDLAVTGIVGIAKLSQNRSVDDRNGVVAGLAAGSPGDRAVATLMEGARDDPR